MHICRRFFPPAFDNRYRGHRSALWLFGVLLVMNLGIALVAIFARDGGAQSADAIPLDKFGAEAATTVIGVVALLGLVKLLLSSLATLALFRYRAMIPLMYLLFVADQVLRRGVMSLKPIVHLGRSAGSVVVWAMLAISVIGMLLSVSGKAYTSDSE